MKKSIEDKIVFHTISSEIGRVVLDDLKKAGFNWPNKQKTPGNVKSGGVYIYLNSFEPYEITYSMGKVKSDSNLTTIEDLYRMLREKKDTFSVGGVTLKHEDGWVSCLGDLNREFSGVQAGELNVILDKFLALPNFRVGGVSTSVRLVMGCKEFSREDIASVKSWLASL